MCTINVMQYESNPHVFAYLAHVRETAPPKARQQYSQTRASSRNIPSQLFTRCSLVSVVDSRQHSSSSSSHAVLGLITSHTYDISRYEIHSVHIVDSSRSDPPPHLFPRPAFRGAKQRSDAHIDSFVFVCVRRLAWRRRRSGFHCQCQIHRSCYDSIDADTI